MTFAQPRIRKAYILHQEDYPINAVASTALHGFKDLGIQTVPIYGFGDIQELEDLGPEVMVEGWLQSVWEALRVLGIEPPGPLDYPEELRPYLGRKLWIDRLGKIRQTTDKVFIKPVTAKLFSGFLWDKSRAARRRIVTCGDDVEVWVSERVRFLSEYRVFVLDGTILDARLYKGDWSLALDKNVVRDAVEAYTAKPRACCLDFGVTDRGLTALVEANDGYAFGHYGLNHILLARMLAARWEELTEHLV